MAFSFNVFLLSIHAATYCPPSCQRLNSPTDVTEQDDYRVYLCYGDKISFILQLFKQLAVARRNADGVISGNTQSKSYIFTGVQLYEIGILKKAVVLKSDVVASLFNRHSPLCSLCSLASCPLLLLCGVEKGLAFMSRLSSVLTPQSTLQRLSRSPIHTHS